MVALSWWQEYKHTRNSITTSIVESKKQHHLPDVSSGRESYDSLEGAGALCCGSGAITPVLVLTLLRARSRKVELHVRVELACGLELRGGVMASEQWRWAS
jgi:hypothetical protein